MKTDRQDNLIASTPGGTITEEAPLSFQNDGKEVNSRFVLNGSLLGFETGKYTGELIIDPSLFWATYYGGGQMEFPGTTATDGSGNVYIAGYTQSTAGIATIGAYQTIFAGAYDVYLAKFNGAGAIQWATYYGGMNNDMAYGVATDGGGNVYVTGGTTSDTMIATSGAYDTVLNGGDAFLVKFNSAGIRQWATYFGGIGSEDAHGVATDASGNVYIAGRTSSSSGVATVGAYQTLFAGGTVYGTDAFLAKFSSAGSLLWATYYGGSDDDYAYDVATDASGNVFITGYTISTSGIASPGAYQTVYGGGPDDAFLAKFNSAGVRQWGTYYGGIFNDEAHGIATDAAGDIYITGHTASPSSIATPGAHQTVFAGGVYDCFIAKFNSTGARQWATYYGGSNEDIGYGIAVDGGGNVFMAGYTESYAGIATPGTYHSSMSGGLYDGFLVKFNSLGVRQWGSYFGGTDYDYASDVCVDASGGVFITGYTQSTFGIATAGAYQTLYGGSIDAFLAKFDGTFIGPVVGPITGTATLCIGSTTTLNDTSTGGTWTSGTPGVATVGATTGIVTGVTAGTATITYTAAAGIATLMVTVYATPAPITGSSFDVCIGSTITLTDATGGGTWSSGSTATATVGPGSGIVTGVAAGTVNITYTSSGCYVTTTVTVLALPNPAISGSSIACVGYTLPLTGATPGGTWSSSNPAVGTVDAVTGIVYGVSAGTTTIKYKVSNVCGTDSATQLVTVVAGSGCALGVMTANTETAIFKIYPNPSQGRFTIDILLPNEKKVNFVVTNIVGEPVKEFTVSSGHATEISLDQPPGIYFIKTVSGVPGYVGKLIIQ